MLPVSELTILAVQSAKHQNEHADALSLGCAKHGVKVSRQHPHMLTRARTKHVACWGWRVGRRFRDSGHEVLVMERGYLGDRFQWTSLGWNGLNGRAKFMPCDDPARFDANFAHLMRPWKEGGDFVLLIGQVPGDASLGGVDLSRWYLESARLAQVKYGLPVRFRPHPMALQRNIRQTVTGAKTIDGKLVDNLRDAAIVVTFNSNTAVESVLAGVPTIATDMGSMAREVCGHKIGDRVTPDRAAWAARLAWCQWSMAEIRAGDAWATVRPN